MRGTVTSRSTRALRSTLQAAAGAMALSACSTMPSLDREPPPLPQQWYNAATRPAPESLIDWWLGFEDETLNALVAEALSDGLTPQIAALRVLEARATGRETVARFLPELSARASGDYTEVLDGPPLVGSFQSFVTSGGSEDFSVTTEDVQMFAAVGPAISWEVPLFGRVQASLAGARANAAVAMADLRDAQAALTADIAQAYIELRAAQARADALRASVETAESLARVLETAASAGLAAEADAADARRLAETARARIPDAEVAVTDTLGRIGLLRGRAPGTETEQALAALNAHGPVPRRDMETAPLSPADLVRARPDVAAAEARVLLAAADLGIARTELLPSLSLTGSIVTVDNLIGSAISERTTQAQFGPVIQIPLFDWGQRWAAVKARDSRFEQALLDYRAAVNLAVAEASGALNAVRQASLRLEAARAAEVAAERNTSGLRAAYDIGIASLSDRLRSEQQLIDARVLRLEAEAAHSLAVVEAHRAFAAGPALETTLSAVERAKG